MEKQFVQGMFYREPSINAPKWIKGNLSFRVKEFTEFLMAQEDERGWVNIDIKESKKGTIYCELNNYKKGAIKQEIPVIQEETQSFQEQLESPSEEYEESDKIDDGIQVKDIPF